MVRKIPFQKSSEGHFAFDIDQTLKHRCHLEKDPLHDLDLKFSHKL